MRFSRFLARSAHPAVEERHRRIEHVGDLLQPARRDAVRPFFVLLHLLERQADAVGEAGLRQAALQPQRADLAPDLDVLGARPALASSRFARVRSMSPPLPTLLRRRPSAGRRPASETMYIGCNFGENWLPKSSIRQAVRGAVAKLSERDAAKTEQPIGPALLERISWDDLRVFVVVARTLSFRKAATALRTSSSTVVRRMERLEETFGFRLFDRLPEASASPPKAARSTRARSRWSAPVIRCARISIRT